ncbi:MAG: sulfatase-like hydrolase/transferase [Chloroflexi bacterium]|nr:sulfatase-like hydrolase/transferase [Chloroflexota bacterium]
MTDTQGANVVGCYGHPEMLTPRLDRLAAEGVRFDRAYTASPVCTPARAALFTGTYPHTAGAWANHLPLGANVRTIGQRLQDHGFHTAYVGKWHLDGTDYFGSGRCPPGWDPHYWYDMRCYLEELTPEQRLRSRTELATREGVHKYGVAEDDTYAHRCSDRAIDFLAGHGDEPFLLVVSYDEPHGPFTCPPPYSDMFVDFDYDPGPAAADTLDGKPAHQKEWASALGLFPVSDPEALADPARRTIRRPMYFGCNSFVDAEIGRVVDAIDRFAPDALVVYTSDHGDQLTAHRLAGKGPVMYDETARIPFIVRWPGHTPTGAVCPHPVSHIDVAPTMLTAAGRDVPPFLEGDSILDTLADPNRRPHDAVFVEFNRFEVDHDSMGGFQSVRCASDGRHKLVINLHYTDELYDHQTDPHELVNLVDSPEHAAARDRLHDQLVGWMNRTRDPFRGPVWERRPWRGERRLGWRGSTRPRPDDGYERRVLLYKTGLPVDRWEYDNS